MTKKKTRKAYHKADWGKHYSGDKAFDGIDVSKPRPRIKWGSAGKPKKHK